jgi:hypothetical protein
MRISNALQELTEQGGMELGKSEKLLLGIRRRRR